MAHVRVTPNGLLTPHGVTGHPDLWSPTDY